MFRPIELPDNVGQQRADNGNCVAHTAGRAGSVDYEGRGQVFGIDDPGDRAREARVGGVVKAQAAHLFDEPGELLGRERGRDVGGYVARADSRAARRDDRAGTAGVRGANLCFDCVRFIGHDREHCGDVRVCSEKFLGEGARKILVLPGSRPIRNSYNRNRQDHDHSLWARAREFVRKRGLVLGLACGLALALSACGAGADEDSREVGAATVFAAASLGSAFEEIAGDSEAVLAFGGSSGLVDQIAGGAPADVFASADTANMDRALAEGLIAGEPVKFATNSLVLVTPPDNPAGVAGLDESLEGAKLVVCAPQVPCGRASIDLAADLGVTLDPVSEELSVTDVLGKVTSGEADAGLVYTTDAINAGESVHAIEIPGASEHLNDYWIALVAGGDERAGKTFIDAVVGAEGRGILTQYGFGLP